MNHSEMTEEEILKLLKRLGVEPGRWGNTDEKTTRPPFVDRQVYTLQRIRDVLEQVVEKDQKKAAQLREQLIRLQFGGGS